MQVNLTIPILMLMHSLQAAADRGRLDLSEGVTVVLDGQVSIRLPEGMVVERSQLDVMMFSERTRLALKYKSTTFIAELTDTFALAGSDFSKNVRLDLPSQSIEPLKIEALPVAAPLEAIGVTPKTVKKSAESRLVFAAYITAPNITVRTLAFYVRPDDNDSLWLDLARRIAMSVAAHTPPAKQSIRVGRLFSGRNAATLMPPTSWRVVPRLGDQVTYRLLRTSILGTSTPSCGIALVGAQVTRKSSMTVTPIRGVLLGKPAEWTQWKEIGGIVHARATVPLGGQNLEIDCESHGQAGLDEARKVMELLTHTPE
jgi:hypothetical protein